MAIGSPSSYRRDQDVLANNDSMVMIPRVLREIFGVYGIKRSSTPAMVSKSVETELSGYAPKPDFSSGII